MMESEYLCSMTRSTKVLLGIANVIPFVLLAISMLAIISAPHPPTTENAAPEAFVFSLGVAFLFMGATTVLSFVLLIYYLVHVLKNPRLDANSRLMWALVILVASLLGNIVYWLFQIWREEDDRIEHIYKN
jgi:hypothetical protein